MTIPNWTCPNCGHDTSVDEHSCAQCHIPKPEDSRSRLASFANVLDTKSFVLPVRRSVIWIWVTITLALPMLASFIYFLVKHFRQ